MKYLETAWNPLKRLDTCWHTLTHLDTSWHIWTHFDTLWYLDTSWYIIPTYLDISWNISTYLDIFKYTKYFKICQKFSKPAIFLNVIEMLWITSLKYLKSFSVSWSLLSSSKIIKKIKKDVNLFDHERQVFRASNKCFFLRKIYNRLYFTRQLFFFD